MSLLSTPPFSILVQIIVADDSTQPFRRIANNSQFMDLYSVV